jgi:hypothetical protein
MTSGHALPGSSLLAGPEAHRCRRGGGVEAIAVAASLTAAAVGIAVAAAGGTLLLRRLVGGFTAAPTNALPWAVVLGGIPLVLAVEVATRLGGDRWPAWLARGGLVAAALAVAPPVSAAAWPTPAAGLAATALALIAALRPPPGWRPPRLRGFLGASDRGRAAALVDEDDGQASDRAQASPWSGQAPDAPADDWQANAAWSPDLPPGFRQRLERYETPAGEDCVRGQVMLSVAAGSRTGHAHVGFCPAFTTSPAVEVTTDCDFVEAEVAAAEILPWGVRVECRLSEPAEEPLEIPVAIRAVRPT